MDPTKNEQVMKDFKKVIVDMTKDILTTFPEKYNNLNESLKRVFEGTGTEDENNFALKEVFEYCKQVYPDKFFNILYQNDCIFTEEEEKTYFLPGISFKELWQDPQLSDTSREVIWKYLQLVLFTVISTLNDKSSLGDSARLFESINEDDLKKKLEETMEQMQHIFSAGAEANGAEANGAEANGEGINLNDIPDPKDIHDHVTGMLDGKLGKLAREIAEETAADLNMDMNSTDSVNDIFKNLFKNPTKLMGIVKNVGSKLDEKLKSGDINEGDLLKEASTIVDKMKNIPGMGNIQSMMEKMGMGNMANMANMGANMGGGKVNMGAFQDFMKNNMKKEQNKDRLLTKLAERQQAQAQQAQAQAQQAQAQAQQAQAQAQQQRLGSIKNGEGDNLVYSTGEEVPRSLAPASTSLAPVSTSLAPSKKKKKNKNKK